MRTAVRVISLLVLCSGAAFAQADIPSAVGARVRAVAFINSCARPDIYIGTLASQYGDTVTVRTEGEDIITALPLTAVREIGVSKGQSRRKGFVRGAIAGILVGGIVGRVSTPNPEPYSGGTRDVSNRQNKAMIAGAAIGLGVGGLAGLAFPMEGWRKIPLPAHVKLAPECPAIQIGPSTR